MFEVREEIIKNAAVVANEWGVLRLDDRRESTAGHLLAGAIFASYPLWLWLGMRHER